MSGQDEWRTDYRKHEYETLAHHLEPEAAKLLKDPELHINTVMALSTAISAKRAADLIGLMAQTPLA